MKRYEIFSFFKTSFIKPKESAGKIQKILCFYKKPKESAGKIQNFWVSKKHKKSAQKSAKFLGF